MVSLPAFFKILVLLLAVSPVARAACPHPRFLTKHVCANCTDATKALDFSSWRRNETQVNTVLHFSGEPVYKLDPTVMDR
jgi:hypothetical protein